MATRFNPGAFSSVANTTIYDPESINRTAYGTVPLPTALPDRQAQLQALGVPVNQLNQALTSNALNDLMGNVSYQPSQNYAAARGIQTGLQGSEFANRIGASDYLNRVDAARQRGATNALNALQGITSTQTISPETQIQLGQDNATLASAPDPQMAANAALGAYQSALNKASSYYSTPSSGGGGGGYAPLSSNRGSTQNYFPSGGSTGINPTFNAPMASAIQPSATPISPGNESVYQPFQIQSLWDSGGWTGGSNSFNNQTNWSDNINAPVSSGLGYDNSGGSSGATSLFDNTFDYSDYFDY